MKICLLYRFTGEKIDELEEMISKITASVNKIGHNCGSSLSREEYYKKNNFTRKQIYFDAIKQIDDTDMVLVVIKSDEMSAGILVEAGYAFAKGKKIILAIKKGVNAELLEYLSYKKIEFDNLEELYKKISKLKI